jgi:3-oxoacyl-[acyl-carrier protein] reductase
MDFNKKTVVITGAASGIGKATAEWFLKFGAKVAAIDINENGLNTLKNENDEHTENLLLLPTDITVSSDVDSSITKVIEWTGKIDILVNSAGIYVQKLLTDMTDEFWDKTIKVNLYGTFYCCRRVAKEMIKYKYGKIINFSSIAGQRGSAANSHYAATKRGIEGFSKSIAIELAKYNINVNCIAPGIIKTPIFPDEILAERGADWLRSCPLGRFGEPDDIAKAVFFLSSEYSDYIVGVTLDVNGGMYIR